jgi:uncharacterized protein (TIGR02001 family)
VPAGPAAAQLAVEAAIQTDYRLRGYSVSGGRPVASVALGYDDPSGLYVSGVASGMIRDGDPELLGLEGVIGYAARLTPTLSAEGGLSRVQYFSGYGTPRNYDYTEVHLGLALPNVAARIRYSPDYFRNDTPTLYAEIDAGIEPMPDWFLSAHVGALTYLETAPFNLPQRRYDWRLGASRQLGRYGVHLELSGRIQDRSGYSPPYYGTPRGATNGTSAVLSLTRTF